MQKRVIPYRITSCRTRLGFGRRQLSEASGVSETTLRGLESGQGPSPRIDILCKVAEALFVLPGYLLGVSDFKRYSSGPMPPERIRELYRMDVDILLRQRQCIICGNGSQPGEPHPQGQCIRVLYENGFAPQWLAITYGFTLPAIEFILSEEYRLLSGLRGPIATSEPRPALVRQGL